MSLFDAGDCDDAEKSVAYCDRLDIERLESQLAAAHELRRNEAERASICITELEKQLAAAKAEIEDLIKRNEYETYECGLCPTETDLSVGHMYCCNCFDESESENKRLRETIERNEDKSVECERLREALIAQIKMRDTKKPTKLDEALSWRENDELADRLARAALDGGKPNCCEHGTKECDHVCHRLGSSYCDSCCSCEHDGGKE